MSKPAHCRIIAKYVLLTLGLWGASEDAALDPESIASSRSITF